MKKNIIISILTIATLVSCSEDFLDLSPKDQANINEFYNSQSDFEVALIGAYGTLMGNAFANDLPAIFDMRSDNAFALANTRSLQEISEFILDASAGIIGGFYDDSYRGIQAANAIINRIDGVEMSDDTRNRIKAEALFIRALKYFYMIQIYGDVPLILTETSGSNLDEVQQIPRTPVNEVYTQVISDLQEAETLFPADFDTPNRGSALAAATLLGKVYLFQENYAEAASKLAEVVGSFDLLTDYAELYAIGNSGNSESIFAIEHIGGADGTGSNLGFRMNPSATQLGGFNVVNQAFYVEENLFLSYDPSDTRRDINAQSFLALPPDEFAGNTIYYCKKYLDETPFEGGNGSNTFYVLRYAEVLLMLAEALNEIGYVADGDAFAHLNEVRERAGVPALTSAALPNQNAFRDAVILERRLELAFEGHRWMDLVRTATAINVMNDYVSGSAADPQIDQNDLLYPIPEGEVFVNPDVIVQNPGY